MLDAETTSQAGETGTNGSCPHVSRHQRPSQETIAEWVRESNAEEGLPPGPKLPGSMLAFAMWTRPTAFFDRCRARYGSRFTLNIRVPPTPFVVVSSPQEIKQMFLAPAESLWVGEGSSSIEKYTGHTGLACLDEDAHLTRRKVMNRAMVGDAVQNMSEDIAAISAADVAAWPRDEVVEMYPYIHRLTLKVVFRMVFGPEPDRRLDELLDVTLDMMQFNKKPTSVVPLHALPPRTARFFTAFRPTGFHRFLTLRAHADRLIFDVVDDRRRNGADGEDLVARLLAARHVDGEPLSTQEIRDEIVTNFVAGTTTTAATIAWALEHLTRAPDVLGRLTEEIAAGEDDAYLTATVQEILRRRPPLPHIIPRLVMKPIEVGGFEYQRGVHLWGSAFLLHHDPEIYPDPYAFRPERFLDNPPGTYTWLPFGGGRRRCLGREIADVEIKCVLREVLSRYEVRRESPGAEGSGCKIVTVAPAKGARVALTAV